MFYGLFFHGVRVVRLSRVSGLLLGAVSETPVAFPTADLAAAYLMKNRSARLLAETNGDGFTIREI